MSEKYIYCPACRTLTVHTRQRQGTEVIFSWMCEQCNPPLEDFS